MTYQEIVKELRNMVRAYEVTGNGNCSQVKVFAQAADAIEELLKAGKAMHTWIFLNSGDEQAAYDECGLTDEMNAEFGYSGQYIAKEISHEPRQSDRA